MRSFALTLVEDEKGLRLYDSQASYDIEVLDVKDGGKSFTVSLSEVKVCSNCGAEEKR